LGLLIEVRIAIDYALQHPEIVISLIPVAPGSSGNELTAEGMKDDAERTKVTFGRGSRSSRRILPAFVDGRPAENTGPSRSDGA
jgi:hypothetical protein